MYKMPRTRRATIADARAGFSELVNRVAHAKERVVVTSRGRPKAAVVPLEDLDAVEGLSRRGTNTESLLLEIDRFVAKVRRRRRGAFVRDSTEDLRSIRGGERR